MAWLIGIAVALLLVGLLPIRIAFTVRQEGWQASATIQVRLLFIRLFQKEIDLSANVEMAMEHMLKRWREKGEPVKPDLKESVGKAPRGKLASTALPALRRLGRATKCSRLRLTAEVGGGDAMESALLAGALWGGAGMLLGFISRAVRLLPSAAHLSVVPNYERPLWRIELDCILAIRLGNAILAIVGLLRQVLSREKVIAWIRDSLRRKGDHASGRAPDSRPDEDGHGKP